MKIWSKENQYQRRQAVQALHRDYAYANYGEDGRFTKSETNDWRHYFWDALSLFNGEEKHIHRANAMIRFGAP
ncbi:MAG: hypothetical protein FWF22_00230, partial [Treponema sp.]|nr:hypothetical protein [Treponema sp.]